MPRSTAFLLRLSLRRPTQSNSGEQPKPSTPRRRCAARVFSAAFQSSVQALPCVHCGIVTLPIGVLLLLYGCWLSPGLFCFANLSVLSLTLPPPPKGVVANCRKRPSASSPRPRRLPDQQKTACKQIKSLPSNMKLLVRYFFFLHALFSSSSSSLQNAQALHTSQQTPMLCHSLPINCQPMLPPARLTGCKTSWKQPSMR